MKLFANTVYIKVFSNRFELRQIETGKSISITSSNSFTTTRLLVGQFTEALESCKNGMKQLHERKWFSPSPIVIIHPMEKIETGLSEVEVRILKELAVGAGARKSTVWVGHELSDQEVMSKLLIAE